MRSRKSRRGEWTTTKRGRIVHLPASPPQSLRDYINRARTTSPSATRMSHKDWTNCGGQLNAITTGREQLLIQTLADQANYILSRRNQLNVLVFLKIPDCPIDNLPDRG